MRLGALVAVAALVGAALVDIGIGTSPADAVTGCGVGMAGLAADGTSTAILPYGSVGPISPLRLTGLLVNETP